MHAYTNVYTLVFLHIFTLVDIGSGQEGREGVSQLDAAHDSVPETV